MSYEIHYHPPAVQQTEKIPVLAARKIMTVCFFFLFLALVTFFWPEGRYALRTLLIPGDPDITLGAARTMADALSDGQSLKEAVSAFCHTVLSNGTPY